MSPQLLTIPSPYECTFRLRTTERAFELDLDAGLIEVGVFDAIAIVPKHNSTFHGIHTLVKNSFMEMGQLAGAATTL